MQSKLIQTIGFIGSGKVASHLAIALYKSGVNILQIYSLNSLHANELSSKVESQTITSISEFDQDIDCIIISISDSSLSTIDISLLPSSTLICHTSGSVDMDVFNMFQNYGVFYPLQTFSSQSSPDMSKIPFCIEANTEKSSRKLSYLARLLSQNVYQVDSNQRHTLHLAAVFANNFSNAMFGIGEEILSQSDLSFDLLRPLIEETASKIKFSLPSEVQTGPAIRNDQEIMKQHINKLKSSTDYAELYRSISNIINKKITNNEKL